MHRILCWFVLLALFVGCDFLNDPEDTDDHAADAMPTVAVFMPVVAIPVDAGWEQITILHRNPLRPAEFYIFPEQNEAINTAYRLGKHFIFELGDDNKGRELHQVRHYIIQPEPPFQDKHKDALQLHHEQETGGKFHVHLYTFLSEGWYQPVENVFGGGGQAVGLGVEFDLTTLDNADIGNTQIGLIDRLHSPTIGRGNSFIKESTRLWIYVS